MPKKGDLSLPSNYRGISLTSFAAKIYNKLILNRLIPFVGPIIKLYSGQNANGIFYQFEMQRTVLFGKLQSVSLF